MMKKVLLVTYHYPPTPIVGAIRPSKFAQYLPEFGWETTVLTVRKADAIQGISVPSTAEIVRVSEWPNPLTTYNNFRERQARKKGCSEEFNARMSTPHSEVMSPPKGNMAVKMKRFILDCMSLPDQKLGWLVPAIWQG